MRPLPRILLNAATVASLFLCMESVWGLLLGIPPVPLGTRYFLYSQGVWLELRERGDARLGPVYSVPWAAIAASAAVLPLVRYRENARSASRRRAGMCLACGYDLRATPARCPECGAVPAAPPPPPA